MPQIGEIKKGSDLGYKSIYKMIWAACIDCGKERWVTFVKGKAVSLRCHSCGGKVHPFIQIGSAHHNWKADRRRISGGYVLVRVHKNDFFYHMADKDGLVAEHRLIMAKHLKRCLLPWEVVHHKNGIKNDNRLENLQLFPTSRQHLPDSTLRKRVRHLEQILSKCQDRITLLEAENVLLRGQVSRIKEKAAEPSKTQQP